MQNTFLTPHFSLLEMCESRTASRYGIMNVAPPEAVENLKRLCEHTLEPLREALGLPVVITSGYRCPRLNEILAHSARRSQHLTGCAADFYVGQGPASRSRFQVSGHRERLIEAFRLILTEPGIDFDQLIIYPTFIHVSYVSPQANRHYIMTANGSGQYQRISREQALALY
ncbi:MAG: hypothetical protein IJK32_09875 [Bacteroidales bacterium]|nr:hypothetical protein [Bacteroidales bacterium]